MKGGSLMTEPFEQAWELAKADFALRGSLSGESYEDEQPDAYGYHFRKPVDYMFKPYGSDETQTITDKNFTLLGPISQIAKLKAYRAAMNSYGFTREEKARLLRMFRGNVPFDNDEPIVQYYNELVEQNIYQEVIDTTTHESGHEAHQLADPGYSSRGHQREFLRQQGRRAEIERMMYDLFDYYDHMSNSPTTEASLKEFIAYMTQNPFDSKKVIDNLFSHPDVGRRYAKRAEKASTFSNERKKRNLENAVLSMASQYLNRTNVGPAQFGGQGSGAARKKIASRYEPVKALLRQIRGLDENEIGSFEDLPKEIQEGIGNIELRNKLTDFFEDNYKNAFQSYGTLDLFRDDPEKFLANYEMIDPSQYKDVDDGVGDAYLYRWNDYGDLSLNPDLVSMYLGYYDSQGDGEFLPSDYEDYLQDGDLFFKPKTKSRRLERIPARYKEPKFGSDAVLREIEDAYTLANALRNPNRDAMDSSMAFTGGN
mgnify:CR=1 FL=1